MWFSFSSVVKQIYLSSYQLDIFVGISLRLKTALIGGCDLKRDITLNGWSCCSLSAKYVNKIIVKSTYLSGGKIYGPWQLSFFFCFAIRKADGYFGIRHQDWRVKSKAFPPSLQLWCACLCRGNTSSFVYQFADNDQVVACEREFMWFYNYP